VSHIPRLVIDGRRKKPKRNIIYAPQKENINMKEKCVQIFVGGKNLKKSRWEMHFEKRSKTGKVSEI